MGRENLGRQLATDYRDVEPLGLLSLGGSPPRPWYLVRPGPGRDTTSAVNEWWRCRVKGKYCAPGVRTLGTLLCSCLSWTTCSGMTYVLFLGNTYLTCEMGRLHPFSASLASYLFPMASLHPRCTGSLPFLKYSRHIPASGPLHKLFSADLYFLKLSPTSSGRPP